MQRGDLGENRNQRVLLKGAKISREVGNVDET